MRFTSQVSERAATYASLRQRLVQPHIARVIMDMNLQVVAANQSFCQTFQIPPAEIKGRFLDELINLPWDILWRSPAGRRRRMELNVRSPSFGRRTLGLTYSVWGKQARLMVLAIENITG